VSTQAPATQPLRRIEPLRFACPAGEVMRATLAVLGRVPRLRVLERDATSVHAVARSTFLRLPMDLELMIDAAGGRLDLRASTAFALREQAGSRARALELLKHIEEELRAER